MGVERIPEGDRLQSTLANLRDLVLLTRADGVILCASPAVESILGCRSVDIEGQAVQSLIHEQSRARLEEGIDSALREPSREHSVGRIRIKRMDGAWRECEATLRSPADASGERVIALSIHDVSGQDQLRRYVERAREQLELSEQVGRTGHFEWDIESNVTEWSPQIMRLYGLPPGAFWGSFESWRDRIHPDDRQIAVEASQRALVDGYMEHDFRVVWPDSSIHWLSARGEIFYSEDGKPLRLVGVNMDITERKSMEAERARLAMVVEQVNESIMITNPDGELVYVNPEFERSSGYARDEVIGRSPRILKSGKQDDAFYRQMWSRLASGESWSGHLSNRRKDGTLYEEDAFIAPLRNASGAIINYVAIKRDVTRELALADQLRQSQKMEAVGQLAGGVAHDFNNLLTVIMGHGHLMRSKVGAEHPVLADLDEVLKAAGRAASLTRQLLAFSRHQVLDIKVFSLNQVILETEKMLRRVIGEDVDLVAVPAQGLGCCKADRGQMEQVLMNLALNARDAMPDGGKLTIETADVELDEAYAEQHLDVRPGRYVMLAVSDTGTGMTPEVKARIFEPFFTTKGRDKGTGLGLATVHGIVKQSGGHIAVYTVPGRGTSFKILLPRVEEASSEAASGASGRSQAGGTETVLLVEDEAAIRGIIRASLTPFGYKVIEAADGSEAIPICERKEQPIDLLLTDVVMPMMSGTELAQRATSIRPDLRVLFMSGYTDRALVHQGQRAAASSFLQKPFTPEVLARRIRETLDAPIKNPA